MIEAVGEALLADLFRHAAQTRCADGGTAVLQVITIDEERFDDYRSGAGLHPALHLPGRHAADQTHMRELPRRPGCGSTAQLRSAKLCPHAGGMARALPARRGRNRAARLRRPVPPDVGVLPRLLRSRVSSRRDGRNPVPDAEVLAAVHTPIGMCSAERVTARGAVSSFHVDSALLTAGNGLRLTSLPRPGLRLRVLAVRPHHLAARQRVARPGRSP